MEQRKRIGDWEADTIIGQNHRQAILSLVERKSELTLLKKVEHNTAEAIEQAVMELLSPLAGNVRTITSDNVLPTKASLPQRQSSPEQGGSRFSSYL